MRLYEGIASGEIEITRILEMPEISDTRQGKLEARVESAPGRGHM